MVRYYNHNFKSNIFFFQFYSFSRFLFSFIIITEPSFSRLFQIKPPLLPQAYLFLMWSRSVTSSLHWSCPIPPVFLHLKCWRLWNLTAFWSTTQNHTSSFCTFLPLLTTHLPPNTNSFHLLQQSRSLHFKHRVTGRVGLVPGATNYTWS